MLPGDVYNTQVQNLTGHPAVSLPAGTCPNGIPFGLMATAPRFRDGMLLELAGAYERAHPWPRVVPGHDEFDSALGLGP